LLLKQSEERNAWVAEDGELQMADCWHRCKKKRF